MANLSDLLGPSGMATLTGTQTLQNKTLANQGDITFAGIGRRIRALFSTATALVDRLLFQSDTTNGSTDIVAVPNGTSNRAGFTAINSSDTTNHGFFAFLALLTDMRIWSGKNGSGTALPITLYTDGSERLRIDTSGQVGIGKTPTQRFDIGFAGTLISQLDSSGATAAATVHRYVASNRTWVTGVNTIDPFGNYTFYDFNAASTRLTIDTTGNVLVTGSGGLGYGVGSGGSVTQATSKSTAVTLNKPSGQITMNAAALAAGASAAFQVTNSVVDRSCSISVVGVNGGGNPDAGNYRIEPLWVDMGAFAIRVTNISAGSLSEALRIQFNAHKGATS